jgi:hypothetical protein
MADDAKITAATAPEHDQQNGHQPSRSGRAISPSLVEMTTVPPSGGPSFDDGYTNRLHNPDHDQGLSVSERSGKHARGVSNCWKGVANEGRLN